MLLPNFHSKVKKHMEIYSLVQLKPKNPRKQNLTIYINSKKEYVYQISRPFTSADYSKPHTTTKENQQSEQFYKHKVGMWKAWLHLTASIPS